MFNLLPKMETESAETEELSDPIEARASSKITLIHRDGGQEHPKSRSNKIQQISQELTSQRFEVIDTEHGISLDPNKYRTRVIESGPERDKSPDPRTYSLLERERPLEPARNGLSGDAVIPWAVTKEEKASYDPLFKGWSGLGNSFLDGDVAIEVFGQSGLGKPDLERVWTLADNGNKGRLNMGEFAVAMHLIFRKLNGHPLPAQLPPELIPPSNLNLSDSIGAAKSSWPKPENSISPDSPWLGKLESFYLLLASFSSKVTGVG